MELSHRRTRTAVLALVCTFAIGERQPMWTQMMNGKGEFKDKITIREPQFAMDSLGKSQADFVEVRVTPIVIDPQASEEELATQVGAILGRSGATIDGGLGDNTVIYAGVASDYSVTPNVDGTVTVAESGSTNVDVLGRIQHIRFAGESASGAMRR